MIITNDDDVETKMIITNNHVMKHIAVINLAVHNYNVIVISVLIPKPKKHTKHYYLSSVRSSTFIFLMKTVNVAP